MCLSDVIVTFTSWNNVRRDDDDINDVASMAGVNLSEESANILATTSELVGMVTHSCKDEAFLSASLLQRRMLEIGENRKILSQRTVCPHSHLSLPHLNASRRFSSRQEVRCDRPGS